jgi:hypothetical protein
MIQYLLRCNAGGKDKRVVFDAEGDTDALLKARIRLQTLARNQTAVTGVRLRCVRDVSVGSIFHEDWKS